MAPSSLLWTLLWLAAASLQSCAAGRATLSARRSDKEGAASKHLYCKLSGGCSQCQANEEIERYCADTGFKELLRCSTGAEHTDWPVVLTYPYPPDVHLAGNDDDGSDTSVAGGEGAALIRVVRSCTEKTMAAHVEALAAEVAAAERGGGGSGGGGRHMGLFHYELVMLLVLGVSLPIVYWRKIRIRHL